MVNLIARLIIVAFSFIVASRIVPGIHVSSFYTALVLAVVWGVLSLIVRPVLTILTLPITLITFGLFSVVINAGLFWFMATFVKGFFVESFIAAVLGTFIVSLGGCVAHRLS